MDDIVIDYNDIEIIDCGDEKYISISLTSSSDEGYRTLYRLAGFNPKDYDEIKDKPEDIADFYLQIFPDGNLKIDGNPLNAEDSKFFNKELHMNIWDRYIANSFKEIQPYKNFRPYGTNEELDELVDSKDWTDRREVARQGYGLDKLIDDESIWVREAVAKQGYGLDKLVNDEERCVREAVKDYLKENRYKNVDEWKKDNPDKVYYKDDRTKGEER